jgi:hypothetical protein
MNMTIRILTSVLGVAALLAVAALWLWPDGSAPTFGLTLGGAVARATVRADLAGLFLGLGIFSLLASAYQSADHARTALILTGAVVLGRVVNLAIVGIAPALIPPLGVELVMMAVYYAGMRTWRRTTS